MDLFKYLSEGKKHECDNKYSILQLVSLDAEDSSDEENWDVYLVKHKL